MALLTRDALVTAAQSASVQHYFRNGISNINSANWRWSTWPSTANSWPTGGTTTGAGSGLCTSGTPGAVPLPTPGAGNTWYLAGMAAGGQSNSGLMLMDRYAHFGGLSANSTAAQSVALSVLPPRAAGDYSGGHQVFLEFYGGTAAAAASGSVSISYTNENGTAGRVASLQGGLPAMASTGLSGYSYGPFQLQNGDMGLRSIESLTLGTAMGANSGTIMLVVAKPLAVINMNNYQETRLGWAELGLPNLGADPCLYLQFMSRSTGEAVNAFNATITCVQG